MPRAYKQYSDALLSKAANAVRKGKSLREAEKQFGMSKSYIQRYLNGKHQQKVVRPPVFFSDQEEKTIADCLGLAADWGFPLSKFDLKNIIQRYLDSKGIEEPRFTENRPGSRWLTCFMRQQKDSLKGRLSHNIKRARAAVTSTLIKAYFSELAETLKDVCPEALINYDETSMQDDPGKETVIVRRKCKYPDRILDSSKSNVSVMFAGTASGICLPPYAVYNSQRVHGSWIQGGPPNTRYNHSPSGWFESTIFEDWFESIVLPYFRKLEDCQKVVIGDNLASHVSIKVLQLCLDNNVKFVLLPPNSTHPCQPLDLAFFSPLKNSWRNVLYDWKMKRKGPIRKDYFPVILKQTLDSINDTISDNMKAGFGASGLYPLDVNRVLGCLPKESALEDHKENGPEWVRTFTAFLKETRNKETVTNPRRKKIDVIPGKSVACEEVIAQLENNSKEKIKKAGTKRGRKSKKNLELEQLGNDDSEVEPDQVTPKPKRKKRKQVDDYGNSSDDSFEVPVVDTDDDMDFASLLVQSEEEADDIETHLRCDSPPSTTISVPAPPEKVKAQVGPPAGQDNMPSTSGTSAMNIPEVDDFVVVNYVYDKGTKRENVKVYVGKIISAASDRSIFTIRFMRNYKGNIYYFPEIDDVDDVPTGAIHRIVKPIHLRRQRYKFLLD